MNMRTEMAVSMLAPRVYSESAAQLGWPADTDMSHSNKCHLLTLGMSEYLRARDFPVRRELHMQEDGGWHYLLAHTSLDTKPEDDDIVTDLSPWQFESDNPYTGLLHGERSHVKDVLQKRGASDAIVTLRGIESIVLPNSTRLLDFKSQTMQS